jgi:hypothetical protein
MSDTEEAPHPVFLVAQRNIDRVKAELAAEKAHDAEVEDRWLLNRPKAVPISPTDTDESSSSSEDEESTPGDVAAIDDSADSVSKKAETPVGIAALDGSAVSEKDQTPADVAALATLDKYLKPGMDPGLLAVVGVTDISQGFFNVYMDE